MNSFRSLAFKNAIFYLVIFLIGLGISGLLLLQSSSKRIIQTAENQLLHSGELIEVQLREYIEELTTDLMFLSDNPVLDRYLRNESNDNYDLLNSEFLSLISSNDDYGQIRFLDASTGKELVRVDRLNGAPVITPPHQLQIKKNREYFSQTVSLGDNEIYFSPINLNREFGSISKPYTPTLRVAKPITFNGSTRGIIVINTDLTKLFDQLEKSVSNDFELRIFNEDGFYLLHEDKDSTFLFEFATRAPQIVVSSKSKSKGVSLSDNALISSHTVTLPQMNYSFYYHVIANKSKLLASYYEWRKNSLFLILFIALLFTSISFVIHRRQFKNLQKLTSSIKDYPKTKKATSLPKNRKDEIGELARSFEEMVEIINRQIESIEAEKTKAEIAEKDKSNFIENITHEIRNPLQSIIGLSTVLEQNNPNSDQIDILNSIRLNTTHLNALVNSILDYQNLLKGNIELNYQYTDISNLIQLLVTGNSYAANQKNIQIKTILDEQLSLVEVNVDRLRVSQIVNNLLINAINHTQNNGEIIVSAQLSESADERAVLKLLVADNGIGMSKSEMEKIKDRYYTKASDIVRSNYGLGLTIVNELLDMMDSELHIESEKNVGSTFSFEIHEKTRQRISAASTNGFQNTSLNDKKILLIEDDPQVQELYRYYFEDAHTTFLSTFENVPKERGQHFDLIISDYYIHNTSLKDNLSNFQTFNLEATGLIIISGENIDPSHFESIFPYVFSLQKPISKEHLFRCVDSIFTFSRFGRPYIDAIKNDYDNDSSKYQKALELLLKEWKTYTLRLVENIRNRDETGLEDVLHKLNNTLRKLRLDRFEKFLLEMKTQLSSDKFDSEKEGKFTAKTMHIFEEYIASFVA